MPEEGGIRIIQDLDDRLSFIFNQSGNDSNSFGFFIQGPDAAQIAEEIRRENSGLSEITIEYRSHNYLGNLWFIIALLPMISVSVRRLHDINFNGWWVWLGFIPLAGWLVMFVLYVSQGDNGENRFGQNPDFFIDDDNAGGISA